MKPSVLWRAHPALQNMKFLDLFLLVIFALLDPDPDSGSGSTDLIEFGSNPDTDTETLILGTSPILRKKNLNLGPLHIVYTISSTGVLPGPRRRRSGPPFSPPPPWILIRCAHSPTRESTWASWTASRNSTTPHVSRFSANIESFFWIQMDPQWFACPGAISTMICMSRIRIPTENTVPLLPKNYAFYTNSSLAFQRCLLVPGNKREEKKGKKGKNLGAGSGSGDALR